MSIPIVSKTRANKSEYTTYQQGKYIDFFLGNRYMASLGREYLDNENLCVDDFWLFRKVGVPIEQVYEKNMEYSLIQVPESILKMARQCADILQLN